MKQLGNGEDLKSVPRRTIGVLAMPGVQLLDVVGPLDAFAEANARLDAEAYRPLVIAIDHAPVRASSGLRLVPDVDLAHTERLDTLLVAGCPDLPTGREDPRVHTYLAAQAKQVQRLGSICTGTFTLARAGLLAGKRVTTHWFAAKQLADAHPDLTVEADHIYVQEGRLYTSAGITAGIDLALAMIEEDFGRKLALAVARHMVVFLKRSGGQSQFSAHLAAQVAERSAVEAVQTWCLANLSEDLSVPALARRAGMSARSFSRHFRTEVGMTPQDFVEAARLEASRQLISDGSRTLKEVAARSGFNNVSALRRAFVRRFQITPQEYRARTLLQRTPVDRAPSRV